MIKDIDKPGLFTSHDGSRGMAGNKIIMKAPPFFYE
jgi:hypothetical protein